MTSREDVKDSHCTQYTYIHHLLVGGFCGTQYNVYMATMVIAWMTSAYMGLRYKGYIESTAW